MNLFHTESVLKDGPDPFYFLLDINLKTLSWLSTPQPSEFNKTFPSQAIKTATLDIITKPRVLSSSPPQYCLC